MRASAHFTDHLNDLAVLHNADGFRIDVPGAGARSIASADWVSLSTDAGLAMTCPLSIIEFRQSYGRSGELGRAKEKV